MNTLATDVRTGGDHSADGSHSGSGHATQVEPLHHSPDVAPNGASADEDVRVPSDATVIRLPDSVITLQCEPEKEIEVTTTMASSNDQQMVVFIDGQFTKIRCLDNIISKAPLDPIAPPSFRFDRLAELETELKPLQELKELVEWLQGSLLADKLRPFVTEDLTKTRVARDELLRKEMAEWCKLGTIGRGRTIVNAPIFKVPKSSRGSRLIFDGRVINELLRRAGIVVTSNALAPHREGDRDDLAVQVHLGRRRPINVLPVPRRRSDRGILRILCGRQAWTF